MWNIGDKKEICKKNCAKTCENSSKLQIIKCLDSCACNDQKIITSKNINKSVSSDEDRFFYIKEKQLAPANSSYEYYIILFMIIVCGIIIFSIVYNEKQMRILYKTLKDKLSQTKIKKDDLVCEDYDLDSIQEEFRYRKLTDIWI